MILGKWIQHNSKLGRSMTKTNKWQVCPAKTQISLHSSSLIRAFAVFSKGSQRFQRQRRLIRQRRCVRWSDSLLGAQIILLLLLYSGSNSISSIKWATSWENLSVQYANNKSADQPAHPHSLISTFVVHCLDSIISLVSVSKISRL